MKIHAQSPCRVDLAGGTLDIWPLYLFHENAVTVNFAVDRYTSCDIITRDDRKIIIRSADQKAEEMFDDFEALRSARNSKLPLLAYIVRFFRPETGTRAFDQLGSSGWRGDLRIIFAADYRPVAR